MLKKLGRNGTIICDENNVLIDGKNLQKYDNLLNFREIFFVENHLNLEDNLDGYVESFEKCCKRINGLLVDVSAQNLTNGSDLTSNYV